MNKNISKTDRRSKNRMEDRCKLMMDREFLFCSLTLALIFDSLFISSCLNACSWVKFNFILDFTSEDCTCC